MYIGRLYRLIKIIWVISIIHFTSCKNHIQERRIRLIFTGIEVLPGYVYSPESEYKVNNKLYSLRDVAEYDPNGSIIKLTIFKPEGILEYDKDHLIKDSALLKSVSLPTRHHLKYVSEKGLIDENKIFPVEVINESIFVVSEGILTVFYKLD
ncbi:hypothetical protein ACX0G7_23695 [Flavitalea antarctica]